MREARTRRTSGFALLPAVLALVVVAGLAFALTRASTGSASRTGAAGEAARAELVAEAGLRHALWRAHQGACTGYDLPTTSFGPHSYAASFTPTAGSPVSVTASATLASGLTRSLTREGVPVFQGLLTEMLVLPVSPGRDTYIDPSSPTSNYGGYSWMSVSNSSSQARTLLSFDVSSIPSGAMVLTAWLSANIDSIGPFTPGARIDAHRLTQAWLEGTKNGGGVPDGATWGTSDGSSAWSTPGGDAETAPVASSEIPAPPTGRMGWELAPLVQRWVEGSLPNDGVLLRSNDYVHEMWFNSQNSPQTALHPALNVVYGCECGGAAGGSTVTLVPGTLGRDTYLSDGTPSTNWGDDDKIWLSNKVNSQEHGLVRFDLSAVPLGAVVSSATLELYLEGIGSGGVSSVDVHRVTGSWTELGASFLEAQPLAPWTTPGGDYDPTVVATAGIDATLPGPTQWDVTSLVNDWRNGASNDGVLLRASNDTNHAEFSSGDHAVAAQHPKLSVTYSCGCSQCTDALGYYLDQFTERTCDPAIDYAGSDGTRDWTATPWIEVGDSGDPCGSGVRITDDASVPSPGSHRLRLSNESGAGVEREVDLVDFVSAVLSFGYRQDNLSSSSYLTVETTQDGSSWTEIGRIEGTGTDASYQTASFEVTGATAIRLVGFVGTNQLIYLDDVLIEEAPPPPPGPATLTLTPLEDTWIREPDSTPLGLGTTLTVGQDAGAKDRRALLRFDPSAIPAGANLVSAKLRLYVVSTFGPKPVDTGLYKLTAGFDETLDHWQSLGGGSYDASELSSLSVPKNAAGWFEWGLPLGLINEWLDFPATNHGLIALPTGGNGQKNNDFEVNSEDHADATLHPQLVIEYLEP